MQSNEGDKIERALVVVPKLNRLIALSGDHNRRALLEDVIEHFLKTSFLGTALFPAPSFV